MCATLSIISHKDKTLAKYALLITLLGNVNTKAKMNFNQFLYI